MAIERGGASDRSSARTKRENYRCNKNQTNDVCIELVNTSLHGDIGLNSLKDHPTQEATS